MKRGCDTKMQLFPKPKTNAEYVEYIRKKLKRSKWLALFFTLMFVLFLVMFLWLRTKIYLITAPIIIPGTDRVFDPEIHTGIRAGVMLGMFLGWFFFLAILNATFAIQCLIGDKKEKLLIKFYDELNKKV